ncbi:YggT family protein [Brachyspira pilosicoli]|uniref:YggT family protein n=1 Tax=Brachyspira pilosicoli TaxID=52584 RepID=A0A5C8ESS9_BRAPL|nr:YggT family protein [Brachyspira pilosicoli]TXJ39802.1 YggT family protein [Brachyspira pilosicoli]
MLIQIINFIYVLIMQALRLYSFIWFIWIIISWLTAFGAIHLDYYNPIVNFFYRITDGVIDKVFGNFRDKLIIGVIDLSPLVFLLILQMVVPPLITMLYRFVIRLIL